MCGKPGRIGRMVEYRDWVVEVLMVSLQSLRHGRLFALILEPRPGQAWAVPASLTATNKVRITTDFIKKAGIDSLKNLF